jgi:hypothetical protein
VGTTNVRDAFVIFLLIFLWIDWWSGICRLEVTVTYLHCTIKHSHKYEILAPLQTYNIKWTFHF